MSLGLPPTKVSDSAHSDGCATSSFNDFEVLYLKMRMVSSTLTSNRKLNPHKRNSLLNWPRRLGLETIMKSWFCTSAFDSSMLITPLLAGGAKLRYFEGSSGLLAKKTVFHVPAVFPLPFKFN